MLIVLVSRDSTDAVPGQGVLALRCATTGAGFRLDIPVVAQRGSSPWSISCSWCSSRTRLLMSFTVPLIGWTIAATATVVISCSSSAGCPDAGVYASRCRVVVDVSLLMVLTILFGTVKPMTGKFIFNYFQYQEVVGCVCMVCMHAELMVQQQ